jgi:hypothetical protein
MIFFNLWALPVGLAVLVALYVLAHLWPASMQPPFVGWTQGVVLVVVGSVADGVGMKARLFFLPFWLIGLGVMGYEVGIVGSVVFVVLLLAAMIALHRKTKRQEAATWAALQSAPPPPIAPDETQFWTWVKDSLFLPVCTDYTPDVCAHDLRILRLIRESGIPINADEAKTIRAQEDFLTKAQAEPKPPGVEPKVQRPMESLVEKRLRAAQEDPPSPAAAETRVSAAPPAAAAPGVAVPAMPVPREVVEAAYSGGGDVDLTSQVLERTSLTLAWIPGWYATDPCLPGGTWEVHLLRATGSPRLKSALETYGFQGVLVVDEPCFKVRGRIDRIVHSKLGELRSVIRNENGSWFDVTLLDGSVFSLDDEDGAGWCDMPGIEPGDWALHVTMTVDPKQVAEALAKRREEQTGKKQRSVAKNTSGP